MAIFRRKKSDGPRRQWGADSNIGPDAAGAADRRRLDDGRRPRRGRLHRRRLGRARRHRRQRPGDRRRRRPRQPDRDGRLPHRGQPARRLGDRLPLRPARLLLPDQRRPPHAAGDARRVLRRAPPRGHRADPLLPGGARRDPDDAALDRAAGVPRPARRPPRRRPAEPALRRPAPPARLRRSAARRGRAPALGAAPPLRPGAGALGRPRSTRRMPTHRRRGPRARRRVRIRGQLDPQPQRPVPRVRPQRGVLRQPRARQTLDRPGGDRPRPAHRRRLRAGEDRHGADDAALQPPRLDLPLRGLELPAQALRLALGRAEQGDEPEQLHRPDGRRLPRSQHPGRAEPGAGPASTKPTSSSPNPTTC